MADATADDRGVSTTLNYVLSLSIATLLVGGLLVSGATFVGDSRETVVRNELNVIGEQIASDVERVDRLVVAAEGATEARLTEELPGKVTGSTYQVVLDPTADPQLALRATDPSVSVGVPLRTETPVGDSAAGGGPVAVRYDGAADRLVIEDA